MCLSLSLTCKTELQLFTMLLNGICKCVKTVVSKCQQTITWVRERTQDGGQ